ncbi:laccase [Epithele typhae]|uniref:laccase n=1 Tax=Epithele typhae TaxID=378194 RepID=UPI0020077694|nr:laccase [Epithele typhae]KAH9936770.1 laccase [Epithele typhae]
MASLSATFAPLIALFSLGRLAAAAVGPIADLTISNANITPDGHTRAAVVVNGQVPGPLVVGNMGDNFQLNVIDNLTNDTMLTATTIHWHGFFQKGTNWADGPAFVNQCPISAGHSFLYDFTSTDQAGTFWYHSHLSTQYCDGLRGPFVVYNPNDPHASLYDVDDESTVITLTDWYHTAAALGSRFPFGGDSTLINGLGRTTTTEGANAELTVITVTKGKRYRFRLVSISCDPNHTFSIDGHNMTIIEVDAVDHTPLTVEQLQIFAGQRYSFVLTADQDVDNYWIRALPNIGTTSFTGGINSAILRYDGAAEIEPTTSQTTDPIVLNEASLVPLSDQAAPGTPEVGGVDMAINLDFSFNGTAFFVNGETYTSPTVPVLLQIMSGASSATDLLPGGSIISLPSNSTIELSFPMVAAAPGQPHPFHLHGHTFHVVRSAGATDYNFVNPPQRDVVSTGTTGDNVTIRFDTNNPGPWFLHCHIDFHLEAGLAVVMAEDVPGVSSFVTPSAAWEDLCPTYNAQYVASA